ncbi:CLUMA_CG013898, isoform A [Clunio marinus]|uniref:Protein MCM10 homolog n=1 Tax=Clunio marinus TaxID=568069 RepID=A0A1J1ING7_9DIPT|nr:CLUMA_CG013898, isoform A [Clunio marinus]
MNLNNDEPNSDDEISNIEKMLLTAENVDDEDQVQVKSVPEKSKRGKSILFKTDGADSSDDEEQRDFQSQKYNEFGRDINKKLKEKEELRKYDSIRIVPDFASLNSKPSTSNAVPQTSQLPVNNDNKNKLEIIKRFSAEPSTFCDPVFGLRIVQPLVSSVLLKERMEGKIAVTVQRARFHTERGDLSNDWAIAGVLINKSPVRQTQKGDSFSIWSISDLRGEVKTVSVFLFRSAHKELWKTTIGTVIGILNPKVMERKDEKIEAALSVDNHQKIMILGHSKDFGHCRAKKNNGEPCGAIINKTDCDVCIFHMKREYSKIRRSEFQSSGLGRGLQDLRNKVLGKSEVFYAGQSFTAQKAAKKPAKMIKQDRERLMTLSEYFTSPYREGESSALRTPSTSNQIQQQTKRPGSAASLELKVSQRKKDLERLKLLQGTDKPQLTHVAKLQQSTSIPDPPKKDDSFVPKLSNDSLTFSFSVPVKKNDLAKQKAAAILKKKPLEPSNPNLIKYRGTDAGKKRLADELIPSLKSNENGAKKAKLVDSEETQRRKEYLLKMMNAKSNHAELVEDKETERRDKFFDTMEKKEAMEERMANTTEMKCKAVICKRCKYIYFSASDMCKQEKHELKVVDAMKRFYQCGDCKNRTVTLFKIPRDPCKNCRSCNWKRTGMMKERVAYVGEELSIRGDEEMFIGSSNKANINLLVPESSQ